MIYHCIRESGITQDIDTVSRDWTALERKLINEVGEILGLEPDWLNNENVFDGDVETVEKMIEPFWIKTDWEFSRIELYVADLETLLRSKLIASEDSELTNRLQDFPDLMQILKRMRIKTTVELETFLEDIGLNMKQEYPVVTNKLEKLEKELGGSFVFNKPKQR